MSAKPADPVYGRTCPICSALIDRRPGEIPFHFNRRRTCCVEHGHILRARERAMTAPSRICEACGATYERKDGEQLSMFMRRRTCSPSCRAKGIHIRLRAKRLARLRAESRFPGDVPLTKGKRAIVDPEDFDRVMQHAWTARQAPDSDRWYVSALIDGHRVKLHQFVMNAAPGQLYDHESRDGLDNRKQNLRPATSSQNAMNRKRDRRNSSGFKGVTRVGNRWRAQVRANKVWTDLGLFKTAEEAAQAYDKAARTIQGKFARLNFPRDGEQSAFVEVGSARFADDQPAPAA